MRWIKCQKCRAEWAISDEDESDFSEEVCDNCGYKQNEKDLYYEDD